MEFVCRNIFICVLVQTQDSCSFSFVHCRLLVQVWCSYSTLPLNVIISQVF
jgi:hypothetical protein